MTEIVLKNIFKSYDQTEVIHGVDLKVESGKFLVKYSYTIFADKFSLSKFLSKL